MTSNALHPGGAPTGILRELPGPLLTLIRPFMSDMASISATSVYLATSDHVTGVSGRYFEDEHEAKPSPDALDEDLAQALWKESKRLTGTPA